MDAQTFLPRLQAAGFSIRVLDNGNLGITPSDKLTDKQRQFLKAHKPSIIAALTRAPAPDATEADHRHTEYVRAMIHAGWAWSGGRWHAPVAAAEAAGGAKQPRPLPMPHPAADQSAMGASTPSTSLETTR